MHKIFYRSHDPLWQIIIAIFGVILLQLITDSQLLPYNKYILVSLELLLISMLVITSSTGYTQVSSIRRTIAIGLIATITAINASSLMLLIGALFYGTSALSGQQLLINGLVIYLTNILMFALWYWELDGGGPDNRVRHRLTKSDFAFPQTIRPGLAKTGWLPGFIDYLYLSATNMTNFAAADTSPLSHRAKILMMTQSLISVVTIVLVVSRAISDLPPLS